MYDADSIWNLLASELTAAATPLNLWKGNKMFNSKSYVQVLALFLCTNAAMAADQLMQCDPVKFVDRTFAHLSHDDALAYLNTITKENWSESRKQIEAGITLPIKVPIEASWTSDDYNKWWSSFKQTVHYTRRVQDDITIMATVASNTDAEMYRQCLAGVTGLTASATLNGNDAVVEVSWHPAPAVEGQTIPQQIHVELKPTGAKETSSKKVSIGINDNIETTYQLTPGVPFELVATSKGANSHVHALIPKIFTCTTETDPTVLTHGEFHKAKNNKGLDSYRDGQATIWKAALEAQGHKNVTVTPLSYGAEARDHGDYVYDLEFKASMDGSSKYGPDPTCTADEPPRSPPASH